MAYQSVQWKRRAPAVSASRLTGALLCLLCGAGLALPARAQPQIQSQAPAQAQAQAQEQAQPPAQVHAQVQAGPQAQAAALPDVIVTAQRSSALASRTPLAISVLSGEQLEAAGLDNPAALGERLPSVRLDGAADGLRITIRGVSSADTTEKGDPSAAFLLDGVYLARPQSQNVALFDLARIEVLRGPQGTLYGRNATAGVISVISNQPGPTLEGAFGAELGDYGAQKGNAMLNVPLGDGLALRAALAYNRHDSYLINRQGTPFSLGLDRDEVAARIAARLALGQAGSLLLRYDSSTQRHNNDSAVPVGNFYAPDAQGQPVWQAGNTEARLSNRFVPANAPLTQGGGKAAGHGVGADLDLALGALRLYYLGARRQFDNDTRSNFYYQLAPSTAIGVRQSFSGQYRQDSHELRLAGTGSVVGRALDWQAGVYYLRERAEVLYNFRDLQPLGLTPYYVFPHAADARARAVFGQATWRLAERWRLTAGARYSDDDKQRTGFTSFQQQAVYNPATDLRLLNAAALGTSKTTWRLGVDADVAPASMLFASVATGYKAGGFNDGCAAGAGRAGAAAGASDACPAAQALPAATLLYQPETLRAWEAGFKTRSGDGRASLQASAFYYDYANLQLSGVAIVAGAPRFVTANAGQASVRGLEVEGQLRLGGGGRLSTTLALLDAHYDRYLPDGRTSWAGRKLDRTPGAAVSAGYEHAFGLASGELRAGWFTRYSGASVISVPSQLLQYRVPGRSQSDLSVAYRPQQGGWRLSARLRNLENKVRPIAIDSFGMLVPSDPRTWSMRLDYRF